MYIQHVTSHRRNVMTLIRAILDYVAGSDDTVRTPTSLYNGIIAHLHTNTFCTDPYVRTCVCLYVCILTRKAKRHQHLDVSRNNMSILGINFVT